jgi:hypothetical protein
MKRATIAAALSLLVSATALGQTTSTAAPVAEQPEPETLTAGGSTSGMRLSGWFLAPTIGTTAFADSVRYLPGLRMGFYLNKRFAVGVAAQGVVGAETKLDGDEVRNLGSYGGLLLQYVWRSNQLIHGTVESTVGDGRWCAAGSGACSNFMVLEPAANVEINVAKHVRVATGVCYRLAVAGGGDGPSTRDVSGMLIRSSLIFGSF